MLGGNEEGEEYIYIMRGLAAAAFGFRFVIGDESSMKISTGKVQGTRFFTFLLIEKHMAYGQLGISGYFLLFFYLSYLSIFVSFT